MLHRHLLLLLLFSLIPLSFSSPLTCPDSTRICTSFLAFKSSQNLTLTLSMFDATLSDISTDPNSSPDYTFIRKNCSCLTSHRYFTNTTFTVLEQSPTNASDLVHKAYNGLASYNNSRFARKGMVLGVRLYCGCSSGLWNYLMSYVMEKGDTVESLSSRFGVSMDSIERANGMTGSDDGLRFGDVYYIPLNSAPGQPYVEIENSPMPAPAPAPNLYEFSAATPEKNSSTSRKFPYWWVIGSMGIAVLLIAVMLLACVIWKSMKDYSHATKNQSKESDLPTTHKFQILKSSSFCNTSGRYFCFKFGNSDNASATDAVNSHINIPKAVIGDALDMEKPIVFSHAEILASADYFSDANLLGHGTYGSVYYGFLQDQEVAIKKMTATKTREFIAEMKVLCKVHHSSLVELIGYAASRDELFLVYEYAQKGSLKSHLHYPQNKGQTSLSWISRVQIALDTARGLEYIHEHTKDHYVHRDIKTSNILLDNSFRAKISDFGLAKLIVATVDGEASATKVVGTIGYLAPEYLRDGLATTKSDVYAFGVVLFELISGKEAIIKTDGTAFTNSDRRSLASVMLGALKNSSESTNMASLKLHTDPSLMDLYPQDCVYKMAMVAKQCVDEDPVLRPDMKQVVISLSQILLSSVEWEAALAGNSQVFSGLVQGR